MIPWDDIDTVLLDMDGTLIDLRFDNHLWNVVVPERYAARENIDRARAAELLYGAATSPDQASLDFYDLDYWTRATRLDIDAIHAELTPLIRWRPGAVAFAAAARRAGKAAILATNAHPRSVALKHRATGLLGHLDGGFNAHELGAPKERADFWRGLAERLGSRYQPARTLLIDDNEAVLAAAERAGVGHLRCVAQPDSQAPPRAGLAFEAIRRFADFMP